MRFAVVGDVHSYWNAKDIAILSTLDVSHTLFVGDFTNENADFIQQIKDSFSTANAPFSAVLGNHDAWASTINSVAAEIPAASQVC